MNICLFTPEEINKPLSKKDPRGTHIISILHKTEGCKFFCGIINGSSGEATISKIDEENIYFTFEPTGDGKTLYPLKMIIGFPRPIQLKRLLRDMASLGVEEVHLCATELGEKSYLSSDLATTDAGTQMLTDGTVQAASTHVPQLFIHKSLKECLQSFDKTEYTKIALDNIDAKCSLSSYLNQNNAQKVIAAIGSERGWSGNERKLLEQNGFTRTSMGKRVLRTETAATVSASIILDSFGVLD